MGGSHPDLGLGIAGSLGGSGAFGGAGTGVLGLLGDVPPIGGPDFGLPGGLSIDPGTGLDAGVLLPPLDADAGDELDTNNAMLSLAHGRHPSNLQEPADLDELPNELAAFPIAPPPPLLFCRKSTKL